MDEKNIDQIISDYLSNDIIYINNQDGTFSDNAEKYTKQLLKDHKLEKGRKPNAIGGRVSLSSGGVAGMLGE